MTKKVKHSTSTKPCTPVQKKLVLNVSLHKELQLLIYTLCFIFLHNVSLHNANLHSVHKELVLLAVLVVSYRPLLSAVNQKLLADDVCNGVLRFLIHATFWCACVYISPVIAKCILTPSGLSFIPGMVITVLCADKPPREVPVPPGNSATPEEIRACANTLIDNLTVRVKWVALNIVSYSYVACYLPFTFAQASTVVMPMSCTRIQHITAILHILVLLVLQTLPTDYIVRLSSCANLLGRWRSAVISQHIEALPEWQESMVWEMDCIIRCEEKTYLATTPTVTAHPSSIHHSLLHTIFSKSFRILKILTLVEGVLVIVQTYQIVSLKYWQQFVPSCLLLLLNLHTITTIVNAAMHINLYNR